MITLDQKKIIVGMGGWDLPPFHQYFYPPKPKKGFRKLEYYSQFFDSVEINVTFYNTALTADHARRWLGDVAANNNFIFTVKLFRGFTHTFDATNDDVRSVRRLLEPLAESGKLGGIVAQFPHSFVNTPERQKYLQQFSRVFYPHRVFVEVRHASWNKPLVYNFLQENKLHLVNVDLPPIQSYMPLTSLAWNEVAYFRMMGRNVKTWVHPELGERYNYYYNEKELGDLLERMKKLREQSNTLFVVFHNDPEANSLVNGFQLRHLVRNPRVLVPRGMIRAFPELKEISSSVNVLHPLFAEEEGSAGDRR
ncbi:MAG: DUF72 domain-containing protein [Bacteroidota bacterium]